jgi:predicted RNA-binding protein
MLGWPWENNEEPFWVNPDNGLEWYIDKDTTKWCYHEKLNGEPPLEAVVFIVAEEKEEEKNALTRILVDKKTNKVLAEDTSLEGIVTKIDIFRLAQQAEEDE